MLVSAACSVLLKATESKSAILAPVLWAVRRTAFPHFAAGVHIEECAATATRMSEKAHARSIIDWSSEEAESPEELERNLLSKLELLESVQGTMPSTASFVAVKLTALVEPWLLETVTAEMHAVAEAAAATAAASPADAAPPVVSLEQLDSLSAADRAAVSAAIARLQTLADAARAANLRLLLDAEQTHRQPAINLMARELQKRTNPRAEQPLAEAGLPPVVYNTFQMYLDDAPLYGGTSLAAELAYAKANGFTLAAKVVRGAYIHGETQDGFRDRIRPSKADTDAAYDSAVRSLLESIAADAGSAAVVIATHNEASVVSAVEAMEALSLEPDHPNVHFAQILGMADHLTYALGLGTTPAAAAAVGATTEVASSSAAAASGTATHNATKLLVYGDFDQVLPWMLRRLQENQDVLGAAARERSLLWRELWRRLRSPVAA